VSAAAAPGDAAGGAGAPLVLDTHAWVWWAGGADGLPPTVRRRVQVAFAEARLWLSAISAWEVALLVQRGRLVLRYPVREWIARAEALAGLRFLPVDTGIAIRSVELPDLHPDPADRLIVAGAERLGATLVTKDERLRAYAGVATLWG
jgi:PIN domain nuclease of toxin-antitoxin system